MSPTIAVFDLMIEIEWFRCVRDVIVLLRAIKTITKHHHCADTTTMN